MATKDDPDSFRRVLETFVEANQKWAKQAPVIGLSVASLKLEMTGEPHRFTYHDVGQAVANLSIEATNLGLHVHQAGGIYPEKVQRNFGIPEGYEAVAGFAIGYAGDGSSLGDPWKTREGMPRQRKALSSFVFSGKWGKTPPLADSES